MPRLRNTATVLQFGHGCDAVESSCRALPVREDCGFNSATVVTPWKVQCLEHGHLGVRGFNSATVVTPWKGRDSLGHGDRIGSFNSATVVTPWKASGRTTSGCGRRWLQFGHGCDAVESWLDPAQLLRDHRGFNSATVVTPWKDRVLVDQRRGWRASIRPRL